MVSVSLQDNPLYDEERLDTECEMVENIVSEYYVWTCKMVLERFFEPDTDLGDEINNIHERVIREGFQYGERCFTINDYCDNAVRMVDDPEPPVNFNPDNLLDITINFLKEEIRSFDDVLYDTLEDTLNNPRDRCSAKQKVFQYYSCIRCRKDEGGWLEFIRENVLMDLSDHIVIAECDE